MNDHKVTLINNQLHKYQITSYFANDEELKNWINNLTPIELNNLIKLNISKEEITFPKEILINKNLLTCSDYHKRIRAMSKLKNCSTCWHLFGKLCNPDFLNSNHYYQDLAIISTAQSAEYALSIIDNPDFINSKYHTEDLILIIESQNPELDKDILITESLCKIASDKNSINSVYHRQDMNLIFKSEGYELQLYGAYHQNGINNLATNPVSLQDPYHLDNMEILSHHQLYSDFLYYLMTNESVVKGKYYREEINALVEAKSLITAIVLYTYITNPQDNSYLDLSEFNFYDYDLSNESHQAIDFCYRYLGRKNNQPGNLNSDYLNNLKLLNELDDKFLPYFESILSNNQLINSPYYEQDINLLKEITDYNIYQSLHQLMTNQLSINSPHHFHDVLLISKATNEKIRKLLLNKAINEESLNSPNHEYDMNYISRLNLIKIKPHIYEHMFYYLFNTKGLSSPNHIVALETLLKGEIYNPSIGYDEYAMMSKNGIIPSNSDSEEEPLQPNYQSGTFLTRIKKIFTHKK